MSQLTLYNASRPSTARRQRRLVTVRRTCHWIKHWNAGRRSPSPCEERAGEGWGEGKSNKNATPLPGPLLRRRRKRESGNPPPNGRISCGLPGYSSVSAAKVLPMVSPRMPSAVGQASPPAGSSGFQPRVGVRSPRPSRNLGQDAPGTGRLEARPTSRASHRLRFGTARRPPNFSQ